MQAWAESQPLPEGVQSDIYHAARLLGTDASDLRAQIARMHNRGLITASLVSPALEVVVRQPLMGEARRAACESLVAKSVELEQSQASKVLAVYTLLRRAACSAEAGTEAAGASAAVASGACTKQVVSGIDAYFGARSDGSCGAKSPESGGSGAASQDPAGMDLAGGHEGASVATSAVHAQGVFADLGARERMHVQHDVVTLLRNEKLPMPATPLMVSRILHGIVLCAHRRLSGVSPFFGRYVRHRFADIVSVVRETVVKQNALPGQIN